MAESADRISERRSRLPKQIRAQVQDVDKLINDLTTKPGQDGAPTDGAPPAAPAAAAPDPTPPAAPTAAAPAPTPPVAASTPPPAPDLQQQLEAMTQRYTALKGKYDKEVPELRVSLAEAQDKVRQSEVLIKQLTDRQPAPAAPTAAAPAKPILSEKELEEYGPEFVDIVGRIAQQRADDQTKDLLAKVETLTQRLQREDKENEERQRVRVFTLLSESVPNWEQINTDPKFLAWLDQDDVFSGRKKRELLNQALAVHDAARVVGFFRAFQEDAVSASAPAARTPSVDPASLIAPGTPRNAGTTAAPGDDKRVYTTAEVADFYAKARRGLFASNPEERRRIESDIIRAASEGRVR